MMFVTYDSVLWLMLFACVIVLTRACVALQEAVMLRCCARVARAPSINEPGRLCRWGVGSHTGLWLMGPEEEGKEQFWSPTLYQEVK